MIREPYAQLGDVITEEFLKKETSSGVVVKRMDLEW